MCDALATILVNHLSRFDFQAETDRVSFFLYINLKVILKDENSVVRGLKY